MTNILDGVAIPFAYKMGYLNNSFREPSFRAIEASYGLVRHEILCLIFLNYTDGISAADICDFSGHLKNNISRAIGALESKGLVTRSPDPNDQRRLLIHITPDGQLLHDSFMPALKRREDEMMTCLSIKEQATLAALLQKLCAHAPDWKNKAHWQG